MSKRLRWRLGFCAEGCKPHAGAGLKKMQKIDAGFLFEIGDTLRSIRRVSADDNFGMNYFRLLDAQEGLQQVIYNSVFSPYFRHSLLARCDELRGNMQALIKRIEESDNWNDKPSQFEVNSLHSSYAKFEAVFIAEIQSCSLYLVTQKGGFSTELLVESGAVFFSKDIAGKAPSAVSDIEQAMRCIAFELPTAAGFHLHRANEAVLRIYWDCVTGGEKRPKDNSMGVYLTELNKLDKGKKIVREHLKSIKDLHRNPLMHPDQTLGAIDEAIDLMSAIRCSIGYMLDEIPMPMGSLAKAPADAEMKPD